VNKSHRKTLIDIFSQPVPSTLEWRRIESLFVTLGAETIEGAGSRVRFFLNGIIATFLDHTCQRGEAISSQAGHGKRGSKAMSVIYKGYAARIEYSDEDGCFMVTLLGLKMSLAFTLIPSKSCVLPSLRL
jgi:hypothetical protein